MMQLVNINNVMTSKYVLASENIEVDTEKVDVSDVMKSKYILASKMVEQVLNGTDLEKLDEFKRNNDGILKLEVGSGVRPKAGYLHLDMEFGVKKPQVDFSRDFSENNLPSDVFDEILSIHFLEHIFWMKCPYVMSEFNRLLKTGGKLFIEVPDYEVASKRDYTKAHLFFETIYMNSSGDNDAGNFDDFATGFNHASTWNEDFLTRLAIATGFSVVRRKDLEAKSVHSWIGVLHLECTKVSKPMASGNFNAVIGLFSGDNKWFTKYKEVYG